MALAKRKKAPHRSYQYPCLFQRLKIMGTLVRTRGIQLVEVQIRDIRLVEAQTRDIRLVEVQTRDIRLVEVQTRDIRLVEVKIRDIRLVEVKISREHHLMLLMGEQAQLLHLWQVYLESCHWYCL